MSFKGSETMQLTLLRTLASSL